MYMYIYDFDSLSIDKATNCSLDYGHDAQKSLFFRSRLLHSSARSWLAYQQTQWAAMSGIIITGRRRVSARCQ